MPNTWLRLYAEFEDDPKVRSLPEVMQIRLVWLLCEHCKGVTLSERHRTFQWRCSDADVAATKAEFIAAGFITEDWKLVNWGKRQFLSDSSSDRTRRYRERKRTSQERHSDNSVTPPDTDTDTDTKNKKPSRAKRTSDPRTNEFRSALLSYWSSKNPNVDMPWDGSEAKQLSSLLAANPTLTEIAFKQLLRHRYASRGVNHAERPRSWLSRATDYAAGPLNQFKQPEGTIHGRPSANLQRKQSSDEAIERAARELDDADETGAGLLPKPGNSSRYRQSLPQSVGGDY